MVEFILKDSFSSGFKKCTSAAKAAASSVNGTSEAMKKAEKAADDLGKKLKGLGLAFLSVKAVQGFLNLADSVTQTTARLDRMNDGLQTTEQLQNMIMAAANRSKSAFSDVADMVGKLGTLAGDAFDSSAEIVAFAEQLGKQFTLAGASTAEQAAAMTQLTQAMASGVLRGDELNSILEQAPTITQAITKYLGITNGELREIASQGAITADIIKKAMFAAAEETDAAFEAVPLTWGAVWTTMQNKAFAAVQPALAAVNQFINSSQFSKLAARMDGAFAAVGNTLAAVVNIAAGIGGFIADNWNVLAPIVATVTAALAAYKVVSLAVTAAQWLWNAALAASPLTWILILATAVVATVAALSSWIAKTTGIAQTGFGVVLGGLNVVWQAIANTGLLIANVGLGIWDVLKAVNGNIGTAFDNTIKSVQGWFYDLLSTALQVVAGICKALNRLPFIEFDYSGIATKADEFAKKASVTFESRSEFQNVGEAWNKGFNHFDVFSEGWAGKAFSEGAAMGDAFSEKVGEFFQSSSIFDGAFGDAASFSGFSPIVDELQGIGTDVAGISKAVNMTKEDIKSMVDMAERQYVNQINLTSQSPVIQVSGANTGNTDEDRQALANAIRDVLLEQTAAGSVRSAAGAVR